KRREFIFFGDCFPLQLPAPQAFEACSDLGFGHFCHFFLPSRYCQRDRDSCPPLNSSFVVLRLWVICSRDDRNCISLHWIERLEHNDCCSRFFHLEIPLCCYRPCTCMLCVNNFRVPYDAPFF